MEDDATALLTFIDTHCHIHEADAGYAGDTESREKWLKKDITSADFMISEARESGVKALICIGTTLDDSRHAIDFASRHSAVHASIGLHPHEAKDYAGKTALLKQFAELASKPKVVAVGECGLDYCYNLSPADDQKTVLRFQLELAAAHNLPLSFHVRESFEDFWPIFDEFTSNGARLRGVLHSFTDSEHNMEKALERGLYIGVNGIATFNKDPELLQIHKTIPIERLLTETDAPFLTPVPYRGTICMPKHVVATAEFLSRLRGESLEELSRATTFNACELFQL